MRAVTAYLTQGRVVDGGRDLDITFVADTPLPLLVTRSLHVRPDDDIETILSSDSFGIDPSLVGPVFRTSEMRRLVHLVINAVLYATSLPAPWTVVGPERRSLSKRIGQLGGKRSKRDAAPPKLGHTRSGESLFLLPGKITISRLRELQACERGAGAEVFSPFTVRGHWRRPPATWKDQLLRWIEPYWKGPEMGALIEREYRMQN